MKFRRKSIIGLYFAGKSQPDIVRELNRLKVNKLLNVLVVAEKNGQHHVKRRLDINEIHVMVVIAK